MEFKRGVVQQLLKCEKTLAELSRELDIQLASCGNGSGALTSTIVQRMVQAGILKPEEAADHPQSSMLERAIGSAQHMAVCYAEPSDGRPSS